MRWQTTFIAIIKSRIVVYSLMRVLSVDKTKAPSEFAHDAHGFSIKLIFSRNIAHELPYQPLSS